ncbi:MAG: flagellar hook-basal body complex protein FliE [Kofleriaceae bacterium]
MTPIAALPRVDHEGVRGGTLAAPTGGGLDLGAAFRDAFEHARAGEATARDAAARFAGGDPSVGIHEVVIASERASIELRYATTLKNKALEAYRELMNTPV